MPGVDVIVDVIALAAIAGSFTGDAVQGAHAKSEAATKDSAPAQPCVDCAQEIPCFTTPKGQTTKDLKQQLQEQQDTINSQSPDEMQQRLDDADARKKTTGEYRPEGDEAARAKTRTRFRAERESELERQYIERGVEPERAAEEAAKTTAGEMDGLDATHPLDGIAGGATADNLGMANKSINRSIGAQWKSRVKALKNVVKKTKARGDKKMNVKLQPCDDEPTS